MSQSRKPHLATQHCENPKDVTVHNTTSSLWHIQKDKGITQHTKSLTYEIQRKSNNFADNKDLLCSDTRLPHINHTKRWHFPLNDHKKEDMSVNNDTKKKKDMQAVSILLNISRPQNFSVNSSLNFIGKICSGRGHLSAFFTKFKLFRISAP